MQIKSARFVTSATKISDLPETDMTELVLVGKSNVGKSSFINALTQRKALARVGSSPGKTQMANLYIVNESFGIVDMPGYGYAKTGKEKRNYFRALIVDYLKTRRENFVALFFLDHRHEPTQNDVEAFNEVCSFGITPLVILTKADKLSKMQRVKMKTIIAEKLELQKDEMFEFSAVDKELFKETFDVLEEILK